MLYRYSQKAPNQLKHKALLNELIDFLTGIGDPSPSLGGDQLSSYSIAKYTLHLNLCPLGDFVYTSKISISIILKTMTLLY